LVLRTPVEVVSVAHALARNSHMYSDRRACIFVRAGSWACRKPSAKELYAPSGTAFDRFVGRMGRCFLGFQTIPFDGSSPGTCIPVYTTSGSSGATGVSWGDGELDLIAKAASSASLLSGLPCSSVAGAMVGAMGLITRSPRSPISSPSSSSLPSPTTEALSKSKRDEVSMTGPK
jgi:hypothetical protein